MKITLAGYVLADSSAGIYAQSKSLNGQIIVDPVDLVGASQRRHYARGNAATTYQFTSWWTFASTADSHDFALGVRGAVPTSGPLVVHQAGAAAGRPPATMARAVLASVVPTFLGRTTAVDWTVQGGLFAPGVALVLPGGDLGPPAVDEMRGTTPIADTAESVAVVFPTAFVAAPVVTGLVIQRPPEGEAVLVDGLSAVSGAGFTADLSAPVSGAGYVLHWSAHLPT